MMEASSSYIYPPLVFFHEQPPINKWDFLHFRDLRLEEENCTIGQEMQATVSTETRKRSFEDRNGNMHLIMRGIYLGDLTAYKEWVDNSSLFSDLRSLVISVVDIDNEQTLSHSPDNVEHLVLTITDDQRGWSDPEGIKSQLENIFQSIDQARLEKRDVLIHCVSGKSRSATVLTAYLMWACRQSFQSVLQFIQMKRWQASPCPEFRKILSEEFQPLLEREGIIQ